VQRESFMSHTRGELAEAVNSGAIFQPSPIACSPWVAMSLMQKAIRRGREDLALRAAATLLKDSPERLWRRCGVTAFEDIGIADLATVGKVVVALDGRTSRSMLGGEWAVASTIVSAMARASKCRAADDLLMIVERHPKLEEARSAYAKYSTRELVRIATGNDPLSRRALALRFAVGTSRRPSDYLRSRIGEPHTVFDHLLDAGVPSSTVAIARQGFSRIGEPLCPLVALLSALFPSRPHRLSDDELPPEVMIGDVPSWAFDMFTREGRSAIRRFLAQDNTTSRWAKKHVPGDKRISFLGDVIFAAESGILRSRLTWSLGELLRECAEFECQGPWCPDAREIIALMRADLPLLDEVRAAVAGGFNYAS
jgi:hypothetical protein